jgi:hypothetical protein
MTRKGESLTLSVSPGTRERLEELAVNHNYLWGDRPNVSAFVEAIAFHELEVRKPTKNGAVRLTVGRAKKALKNALDELENI